MSTTKQSLRKTIYVILERENHSLIDKVVHYTLMGIILMTVIAVILESDVEIAKKHQTLFTIIEYISLTVFTIEYILRVWSSGENSKYKYINGRIKYMFTPMAIIDLLAILPALMGLFISKEFMILRGLRLIRIFKLTRYSRSMNLLTSVLKQESANIFSAFFVLTILILIAATGIYIVEGKIQPENFGSIPKAIWWATVTLTTVGYGDVVPFTTSGKVLGIIILMFGIGMAALPAGILASGFTKEINRRKVLFRNKVMSFISKGELKQRQRNSLKKLAVELSIPPPEVRNVIQEIKSMQLKLTEIKCPHCEKSLEIEHYSSHISLKNHIK